MKKIFNGTLERGEIQPPTPDDLPVKDGWIINPLVVLAELHRQEAREAEAGFDNYLALRRARSDRPEVSEPGKLA